MGAYLVERDLPLLQPLDQEGPRDIQQISGLLRRELGVHRAPIPAGIAGSMESWRATAMEGRG